MTFYPAILRWLVCSLCVSFALARAADTPVISRETIRAAETVIGLEFTETERELMAGTLNKRLRSYETLRRQDFPNELAPAFVFHPLPRNFQIEKETAPPVW